LTGVKDEYNPLRPNDYEELMKKKKEQKQKEKDDDERRREFREDTYDIFAMLYFTESNHSNQVHWDSIITRS